MKQFIRLTAIAVGFLLVGLSTMNAQEVVFTSGPAVTPRLGGSNGGFAWGDINGDGTMDVFIPSNNVLYNNITSFTSAVSTATANLSGNTNSVGGLLADINGDGLLDIWSTNNAAPQTGLFYDSAGVFLNPTGTGDLATSPGTGTVFAGMAVADIDHSNYLTAAWNAFTGTYSDGLVFPKGLGISLLKGGPSGFTKVGKGATAGNLAIDTTRSFETWDVHFLDANNDGWQDLLMPSFRHGFSSVDIQVDSIGARKGCILYMNDGTGKFIVPTGATLGRTIYCIDSISAAGVRFTRTVADTGIIVDDTVRHFNAIGSNFGDLNNDGKMDLLLTGTEANNYDGLGRGVTIVLVYGKGDGTFTFKWNGTNVVDSGLPTSGSIRAWDIGDYNNDGIPDIYASTTFGTTRLFRGNGNGKYAEVTNQDNVATAGGGRAGGFIDYNNDGFLDIYNYTGLNSVLQMNSGNSNHWIGFAPVGTGHNMSAIGTRFTLYTQGGTFKQYRYVKAEGNAAGHGEMRAVFGIGINTSIDSVNVKWPDGTSSSYSGLAVDKYWTVKYGSAIPNMPALVSPANAAVGVLAADTLKWSAATSALSYNVQVSMDPTFAKKLLMAVNKTVNGTSYAYSLGAATKYYWRVAAVNGGFTSAYTAANNFTTAGAAAAAVPVKVSPIGNATNQAALLTLKVKKTSDASRYQWQISTLPTFTTFFINDSTADTTLTAQLSGGQTFYWRARGMNDLGASAYSTVDTFTVMTPPARPTLLLPANSAQNVISDSALFVWSKVSTAASYNLQVSTVNSTNTYPTTDTSYLIRSLAKLTNYTWKIEAINAGGTSYYTTTFGFTTIIAAPAVPSASLPASSATGVNRLTKFTWGPVANATKYRLQVATDNAFTAIVVDTVIALDTVALLKKPLASETAHFWQLNAQNIGGASAYSTARLFTTGTVLGVQENAVQMPKEFALAQNYPNPFNPSTTIGYDLPKSAYVSLKIYDVLGRLVVTLADGIQVASHYKVEWNASGVSSGVYFYRIEARPQDGSDNFSSIKKLMLLK